jgi:hypothetical protein
MKATFDEVRAGYSVVVGAGLPFASITIDDHLAAVVVWAETQRQADARARAIVQGLNALDPQSAVVLEADQGGTREVLL